jgi:hypothetical protein
MTETKKTFYRVMYRIRIGSQAFVGELTFPFDGFEEMADVENRVKKNLEKWRSSAQLEDIINVEKFTL